MGRSSWFAVRARTNIGLVVRGCSNSDAVSAPQSAGTARVPGVPATAGNAGQAANALVDYSGWAQHLPQFFLSPVPIESLAASGESSGGVLNRPKMWGGFKRGLKTGDYVLIQLGHNDKTTTEATFESSSKTMLTQAKTAGAFPILVTPISGVGYTLAEGHVNSVGANLPQVIRDLGKIQRLAAIDLTVKTWN